MTSGLSLAGFLDGLPDLRDGACLPHRSAVPQAAWDGNGSAEQTALAIRACESCAVLGRCAAWVAGLPRKQRPAGIVAARRLVFDGNSRTAVFTRAPGGPGHEDLDHAEGPASHAG